MFWRGLVSALGTTLLVFGLSGFAFVASAPALPTTVLAPISAALDQAAAVVGRAAAVDRAPVATPRAAPPHAITRLVIRGIDLDTPVVPAVRIQHDGSTTWEVPRFIAGHAEGTAAPGEPGNAVVLGHVTSVTLGHVFEHLDRVNPGDPIEVYAADLRFEYVATRARSVDRTDAGVLEPTTTPTLTLITCTGAWLPLAWDYAERFVVQAELIEQNP